MKSMISTYPWYCEPEQLFDILIDRFGEYSIMTDLNQEQLMLSLLNLG